ncbi:MAG: DUF1501 domain-containing protein [Bryobacterales bacterium]
MANPTRRAFLTRSVAGLGALSQLLGRDLGQAAPHFAPTAKRVIYPLPKSGAPSRIELFDHKPEIAKLRGRLPPRSARDQRLLTMTATQDRFPDGPVAVRFQQLWSALGLLGFVPHMGKIVDDLTFIRTMNTEQINHDPAITFFQTGFQLAGRPSIGAWLDYGLGSENQDLPRSSSWCPVPGPAAL